MKLISAKKLIETPDNVLAACDKELRPYGVYLMENGDRILFNRSYLPMLWWKNETGQIMVMNNEWVRYKTQVWFYTDSLSIKKTSKLRQQIMSLWLHGYAVLPEDMPLILKGIKEFKN